MLGANDPQIGALQGAHLIMGPAGSGKTTALVQRYVDLVRSGADGILLLVGSRRAARTLTDRILREVGASTDKVNVATWQQFAQSILRDHFRSLGYAAEPALLAGPDQFALVREMLQSDTERAHWSEHRRHLALSGFVMELREFVLRAQDALESPEQLEERARLARRDDLAEAARFFRRYLDVIDSQSLVDYTNVIAQAIGLLQKDHEAALAIKGATRHLLVDEYQDVTPAQLVLLRELFVDGGSVAVAANPDARAFGFRGSASNAVEQFRATFKPVNEIRLAASHRAGATVQAWQFDHLTEEADAIAREAMRAHRRDGVAWGDVAVIVRRYGAASRAIRHALEHRDIPYVVVGENRPLYAESALRPMLELARAAYDTAARDELLPGVLASPVGGLDAYEVRALRRAAKLAAMPLSTYMMAPADDLPEHVRDACVRVRAWLDEIVERDALAADEVFWWLWQELPYFREMVDRDHDADLDAVAAFARAIERFSDRRPGLRFSDYLSALEGVEFGPEPWRMPEERRPDAVRLLTAHHAVGAEFDVVFVAGAVEGEFPDTRDTRAMLDLRDLLNPATSDERKRARVEEEARLFGIATSRARRSTIVTAARESSRGEALTPTPFLAHLDVDWSVPPPVDQPLTRDEAEAYLRRRARDGSLPESDRVAAIEELARLRDVDPDRWWYERDWTDTGRPLHDGEMRTSYSRLSPFEACGLKYLYQVELGLDTEQTHHMLVGSWIHDIVDRCAKGELPAERDALIGELRRVWRAQVFPSAAIEHRMRLSCEQMIDRWLAAEGKVKPLASEVEFTFEVEGATLRGYIDRIARVANSVKLTDYKTGNGYRSQQDVEEDLQLATYFLATKRDPNLAQLGEVMYMELSFLARQNSRDGYYKPHFDPRRKPEYEAAAQARIEELVRGIRAEQFAPRPDADCMFCKFKPLCPVWPEGDEVTL